MSAITVQSFDVPDCRFLGSTAKLRLYADDDWTDSLGIRHCSSPTRSKLTFYQEINCTLSGGVLTVPTFVTYSTLDARQNAGVRISGEIFDQSDDWRKTLFENWFIPLSPASTSRDQLEVANQGQDLSYPPLVYLDEVRVRQLIDAALSTLSGLVPIAHDIAVLVGGTVTVPNVNVVTNPKILATGMDDDVSGAVRSGNPVVGVSFDLISTNGADSGSVFWAMYN